MSVRFCRECGARMTETDKFCFNCGTPSAPVVQKAAAEAFPSEPAVPVFVPDIPTQTPAPVAEPVPEVPVAAQIPEIPEIPAEPTYIPPVESAFTPSSEPTYIPPVEPAFTPSAEPAYIPPVEPSFQPMQAPIYSSPVQPPVYPSVQEPNYGSQVIPGYDPMTIPAYGSVPAPSYSQPVQPAPQTPAKPVKAEKPPKTPKPLPKRKFLNVLGCVLVSILLIALILPTVLLVDIRMMSNEEKILGILERVDLDAIPAKEVFTDIDDDRTMLDWACEYMNQNFSETFQSGSYHWSGIQPKSLQNFLDDSTFLDLTAKTVSGLLTDLIEDTSKTSLDAGDIEDFLADNKKFLEKEFELALDQSSRQKMAQQTMEMLKLEEISLDELPDSPVVTVAGSVLSIVTLILLGVLVALLILLLFLMSRKYIMAGIHDTGLVFLICGIVLLALTGAARLMVSLGAGESAIVYLAGILAGGLLESGLLISVCIFAFGLLLLIISGITLSVLKKRAAKA